MPQALNVPQPLSPPARPGGQTPKVRAPSPSAEMIESIGVIDLYNASRKQRPGGSSATGGRRAAARRGTHTARLPLMPRGDALCPHWRPPCNAPLDLVAVAPHVHACTSAHRAASSDGWHVLGRGRAPPLRTVSTRHPACPHQHPLPNTPQMAFYGVKQFLSQNHLAPLLTNDQPVSVCLHAGPVRRAAQRPLCSLAWREVT